VRLGYSLTHILVVVASLAVLSTLGMATATGESPDAVEARNLATVRSGFDAW